jgi:heme exporter protein C
MALSAWAAPLCAGLALAAFAFALPQALGASPADYQMGETVRIMYVHVPAASLSLGLFAGMGAASFVSLVWRHSLADVAARAMAPVGAVLAALCLITGAIWGEPTWGTWWYWGDARLTSMLVLFITYVGYLALWGAVEDEARAAKLAAILCLVGLINLPIIRYSVEWWSSLHQSVNLTPIERAILDPEYSRMCNPQAATGPLPEACRRPPNCAWQGLPHEPARCAAPRRGERSAHRACAGQLPGQRLGPSGFEPLGVCVVAPLGPPAKGRRCPRSRPEGART